MVYILTVSTNESIKLSVDAARAEVATCEESQTAPPGQTSHPLLTLYAHDQRATKQPSHDLPHHNIF